MDIYQILGFIGMLFIVYGYFLLQAHKLQHEDIQFQIINLVGAILLLISLLVHFNLGSFLIEVFWIIITIYGMIKTKRLKREKRE